jgi:hypothetical protein
LSPVPPLDWDQSSIGSDLDELAASLEDSTHNDLPVNSQRQGSPFAAPSPSAESHISDWTDASNTGDDPFSNRGPPTPLTSTEGDLTSRISDLGPWDVQSGQDVQFEKLRVGTEATRSAATRRRKDPKKGGKYVCPECNDNFTTKHNWTSASPSCLH